MIIIIIIIIIIKAEHANQYYHSLFFLNLQRVCFKMCHLSFILSVIAAIKVLTLC